MTVTFRLHYPDTFQWICAYCDKHREDCACEDGFAAGCCACWSDITCACGNPSAPLQAISDDCRCKPILAAMYG